MDSQGGKEEEERNISIISESHENPVDSLGGKEEVRGDVSVPNLTKTLTDSIGGKKEEQRRRISSQYH